MTHRRCSSKLISGHSNPTVQNCHYSLKSAGVKCDFSGDREYICIVKDVDGAELKREFKVVWQSKKKSERMVMLVETKHFLTLIDTFAYSTV